MGIILHGEGAWSQPLFITICAARDSGGMELFMIIRGGANNDVITASVGRYSEFYGDAGNDEKLPHPHFKWGFIIRPYKGL